MTGALFELVDDTLDRYAQHLPQESTTLQAIMNEETWGEIASCARGEGYFDLADFLIQAEKDQWNDN